MICGRAFAFAALLAGGMPGIANACTDGSAMRSYLLTGRPPNFPGTMVLKVAVSRLGWSSVEARLLEASGRLSLGEKVLIDLPEPPGGANCVDWGADGNDDAPLFAVVIAQRYQSGRLRLTAIPIKAKRATRTHAAAELDKYIVDPAYLAAATDRSEEPRK